MVYLNSINKQLLLLYTAGSFLRYHSVDGHEFEIVGELVGSNIPTTDTVEYECRYTNLWTSIRHPNSYPMGDAVIQTPIMASHVDSFSMWGPGMIATPGFEKYAETGSVNLLIMEILDAGSTTGDIAIGHDFNTNDSDSSSHILQKFNVEPNTPLVSCAAMLAPSPDWFTGFYDFDARDRVKNTWYETFTIETYPWDAGTEQGSVFMMGNRPESTFKAISQITSGHPHSTLFADPQMMEGIEHGVRPVGRWECRIVEFGEDTEEEAPMDNMKLEPTLFTPIDRAQLPTTQNLGSLAGEATSSITPNTEETNTDMYDGKDEENQDKGNLDEDEENLYEDNIVEDEEIIRENQGENDYVVPIVKVKLIGEGSEGSEGSVRSGSASISRMHVLSAIVCLLVTGPIQWL